MKEEIKRERDKIYNILNPKNENEEHGLVCEYLDYQQMFLKGKLEAYNEILKLLQ